MPVENVVVTFNPQNNRPSTYMHPFRIKNIYKVVLTAATIPNSQYIIHNANRYFYWTQGGVATRISLNIGNTPQTADLLASEIQKAVRNHVPSEPGFVCRVGALGRLELVAQTKPFSVHFDLSTLYRNMGLNGSASTNSLPNQNGTVHILQAPNLPARYTSHIYNVRMALGAVRPLKQLEHIIIRRDDAITYFSAQKKERQTAKTYDPPIPFAQQFRFDLLDDSGQRVHLNNLRVTLVLSVHHL